jgi:hypothetical protein
MRPTPFAFSIPIVAALLVAGCDRGAPPGAETSRSSSSTVQPTLPTGAASTPMPVSPSGQTNESTAGRGNDLSNSTRASGRSNVYEPASTDNPASGASATAAASGASQSTSSQTRGTSPTPNNGSLPGGTEGNSGSRRGGGKG